MPVAFDARAVCGSSPTLCVPKDSLDAVVTDPPYHDDVHYAELSDLFRSWAGIATGVLDGDAIVRGRNGDHGTHAYQALVRDVFKEIRRALRPGGHLVLSYANRHPDAWVALFCALEEAGFYGVGYTVVLSENDADNANVGRRACNLDVLIDLVLPTGGRVYRYQPEGKPASDEEAFCRLVGRQALRIGRLGENWADGFTKELRSSPFIV
jgi:adenine-specific DNA methylase